MPEHSRNTSDTPVRSCSPYLRCQGFVRGPQPMKFRAMCLTKDEATLCDPKTAHQRTISTAAAMARCQGPRHLGRECLNGPIHEALKTVLVESGIPACVRIPVPNVQAYARSGAPSSAE